MSSIRDGLVSFWDLAINSKDKFGKSNGTDANITYDGKSASFNGTSSYINTGKSLSSFNNQITISFLVYSNSSSQGEAATIFSNQNDAGNYGVIFARNTPTSNRWGLFYGDGAGHWNTYNANYFEIIANTWHRIVITITDGNKVKIFMDGKMMISYTGTYNINFGSNNLFLGQMPNLTGDRYFNGKIRKFGISNIAMPDSLAIKLSADLRGLNYPFIKPNLFKRISNFIGDEPITAPDVDTIKATPLTTTAKAIGEVIDDGGASVTERGIVFSTTANPTTANNKVSVGTGIGSFEATLTGLSVLTTYHYRAYAINSIGTSYGDDKTFTTYDFGFYVNIRNSLTDNNYVNRKDYIDWTSLTITEVLSNSPDSCSFKIKQYGNRNYEPQLGEEIQIVFDGEMLFGGYIVDISKNGEGLSREVKIKCKDYTHILDRILISKTYTNQTANSIIADLVSTFAASSGLTIVGVNANVIVNKIVFNYVNFSTALTNLAKILGSFDWNITPNKDLQFFDTNTKSAPFEINDNGGNFIYNSLNIQKNNTQIKNKIIIRGGITEGTTFTDNKIADGVQKLFFVGYNLTNFSAGLSVGTTIASGFTTLNIGIDGKDNETSFDAMYNADNGLLRFKDSNIPASAKIIKYSGNPNYPLLTEKGDLISIDKYGEYQAVIVDKNIKSKTAASQRATAELLKYSRPQANVSFMTTANGLKTGQIININSDNFNLKDEKYKISNIVRKMRTPTTFIYQVSLTIADDTGLVDLLKQMLIDSQSEKIDISQNEVVDRLFSLLEEINFLENYVLTKSSPINEIIQILETINTTINKNIEFVLGEYTLTSFADNKRAIALDGAYLS